MTPNVLRRKIWDIRAMMEPRRQTLALTRLLHELKKSPPVKLPRFPTKDAVRLGVLQITAKSALLDNLYLARESFTGRYLPGTGDLWLRTAEALLPPPKE